MMIETLNKKGYNGFTFSVPSWNEVLTILGLAAPLFVMMISRVIFYQILLLLLSPFIIFIDPRHCDVLGGILGTRYIFCYIFGH